MIGSGHALASGTGIAGFWSSLLQRNMTSVASLTPTAHSAPAAGKHTSLLEDVKAGLSPAKTSRNSLDTDPDNKLIMLAGAIMLASIVRRRISLRL